MAKTTLSRLFVVVSIMMLAMLGETSADFAFGQRPRASFGRNSPPPVLPLHYGDGTTTMLKSTGVNGSDDSNNKVTGWRAQLLQASNIASLLCVLDCTVLPVVTVVLPFFGLVAASPAQMEFLHQLGHGVALWFVLPVGGSATLLNYLYAHQQKRIAVLGSLGLFLVFAANAPHSVLHPLEHGLLAFLYPLLHAVHHGIAHRLVNILGCACLLTSNYLSKQSGKCLHGHDHSECSDHKTHGHSHNHDHDQ